MKAVSLILFHFSKISPHTWLFGETKGEADPVDEVTTKKRQEQYRTVRLSVC